MSIKMKGLLKGLRYISQIFDEDEEEKDMQIGFPTDVKHVAHIGWDGPSQTAPSWMNEFKSPDSGPLDSPRQQQQQPTNYGGNANNNKEYREPSSYSRARSVSDNNPSSIRESSGLSERSSRRQPSVDSTGSLESTLGSPNPRTKDSSSGSSKSSSRRKQHKDKESKERIIRDGDQYDSTSSSSLPNIPKKSRRKKSKDGEQGSVKHKSKGGVVSSSSGFEHGGSKRGSRHGSRHGSDDSSSKSYTSEPTCHSSGLATLQEEEVKG